MSNSYKLPTGKVLVLRTCNGDLTSRGGFQWKPKGIVKCTDWSPERKCGNGLHGLLWGSGDASLLDWSADAKWLVVEVPEESLVDLSGKVKFSSGKVVYCGDCRGATSLVDELAPAGTLVVGLRKECGDRSTLTGGDRSTLTGGYRSTLTGGYRSTLTGGYESTLTGGDMSTLTGGDRSTLTGGYGSTLTGGDESTLTFTWWDGFRRRLETLYPGEDGIEINKPYHLDVDHNPVKVLKDDSNEKA